MPVIGLDIGSTGCKATLLDEVGQPLGYAYHEYQLSQGATELDPDMVWQAAQHVLAQLSRICDAPEAICISSFGESSVLLDEQDRVLAPSMLYTDPRGLDEVATLVQRFGQRSIMARTGAYPHPMYSLPKWMWLQQRGLTKQAARVMLFGDYILYMLSGERAIDRALAARTMALSLADMDWDAELLAAAGLLPSQLSQVLPAGTVVGQLRPQVAAALGLSAVTRVITGSHDQVCAALGAGVLRPGLAVDGVGTVECLTPAFDAPLPPDRELGASYSCVPYAIPGMFVTYAFNFTGGALLKWYRDQMVPEIKAVCAANGEDVYDVLAREAGETQLLVLPHFAGAGTPSMDVHATGAILGWNLNTTRAEIYRALMEGASFEMRYNLDCLRDMGIPCDTLHAVGGGARSPLWMQIKADIMGSPITTLHVEEAGTMGTALLAWTALRIYPDLQTAAAAMIRPVHTYQPADDGRYAEKYQRYRRMQGHIKAIMEG